MLAMGIDKYNAECRAIVMRYSKVIAHARDLSRKAFASGGAGA